MFISCLFHRFQARLQPSGVSKIPFLVPLVRRNGSFVGTRKDLASGRPILFQLYILIPSRCWDSIACREISWMILSTLFLSLAEVSKNGQPFCFASSSPSAIETTRSVKSDLFPTNMTGALAASRTLNRNFVKQQKIK